MSVKPTGRRMVLDAELAAIQDIADILQPLSEEQLKRVIVYTMTRFAPTGMTFSVKPIEPAAPAEEPA